MSEPTFRCRRSPAPSNTPDSDEPNGIFRIDHPFHPGHGQQFAIVTIRLNWGEELLYFHNPEGRLISIPACWTNRIAPDPVVAISAGRSPFRLQDLMELARLVALLEQEAHHGS